MKRKKLRCNDGSTITVLQPETEADYREVERLVDAGECQVGDFAKPKPRRNDEPVH